MSKIYIDSQNMKQYNILYQLVLIRIINTTKNGTIMFKTGRMIILI